MDIRKIDQKFFQRAVELAEIAEKNGNLPIGSVITFNDEIVSEGKNSIWFPELDFWHHAEMEALSSLPPGLRTKTDAMTLYTTLEPCLMCAGAILLYKIGRVMFGSQDPFGGSSPVFNELPPYFAAQMAETRWLGPVFIEECDPLYERAMHLEGR